MFKIYAVDLSHRCMEVDFSRLPHQIPPERRSRIDRCTHPMTRWRELVGELLADSIIRRWLCLHTEAITIRRNPFGKPYLPDHPGCHFNLSHSGMIVLAAVGPEPVGIDVESVRPLSKMMRIAARFFSEKERSYLETKPEHQRLEAFFDLWTLKESYIKAVGTGLSRPLKSFSVVPTDDDSATLESERDEAFRFFRRYTLLEGYKVAICSREARFPEEIQMIDFTPSEL